MGEWGSILGPQLGSGAEQAARRAPGLTPKCSAGAALFSRGEWELFFVSASGLLIAVASLAAELGL